MNPTHLRTFLAVQKHLNYTHAARELLLSQPAVSRQVRELERDLGVRLFEQLGKRLHLTAAGNTLAREAPRLLGDLDRLREELRAHAQAHRGALRIAASTTPGLYLLPPVLGRFHRAHPEVEVSYAVDNSLRVEHALLHNEVDLGFVGTRLSSPDLIQEPVCQDEIVLFAGRSHALAGRKRLEVEALRDEAWVTREKGSATRRLVERRLSRAGIDLAKAVVLSSPEAVKAVVAGGFGVSFLSLHGLREDLQRGRVVKIPAAGFAVQRRIYAVRHRDKHRSAALGSFLEEVRRAVQDR